MRYEVAVKEFKCIYLHLYIKRADYWQAQLAWSEYVDGLLKSGEITQKQYGTWGTPFPYGKPLKPSYRQLCMAYDR